MNSEDFRVSSRHSVRRVSLAGLSSFLMFAVLAVGFVQSPASAASSPAVTAVSPATGSVTGGTSVTITGSGFTGASSVYFGIDAATFTVNSDTSITATSPAADPGAAGVTVTTAAGTSALSTASLFNYTLPVAARLVVTKVSTFVVAGATRAITITGTGFVRGLVVRSNIAGTTFKVVGVSSHAVRVRVTVKRGSPKGMHRLTVINSSGARAFHAYLQK